jgi:hypothetical protein
MEYVPSEARDNLVSLQMNNLNHTRIYVIDAKVLVKNIITMKNNNFFYNPAKKFSKYISR